MTRLEEEYLANLFRAGYSKAIVRSPPFLARRESVLKPSPQPLQPPAPPVPPADRPGQFSISALMLATGIAAALLAAARLFFRADWEIVHWLLAPLFSIGAIYICLRLPFILTAIGRQRAYYRALQHHRSELVAWTNARKSSRTGDSYARPN